MCNDTIDKIKFIDKKVFLNNNNLKFDKTILICCHPEISKKQNKILINNLLRVLKIIKILILSLLTQIPIQAVNI